MAAKKNNQTNTTKDINYYKKKFWRIFAYFLLGILAFFLFASWGLFGSMPSFEDLENPDSNLATEVISSDGVVLGKYFKTNRSQLKYSDLPKNLVEALVATEDARFYEHSGIDGRGTLRAVFSLGTNGGASTLTQQLAKQLFHGEGSRFLPFRILQKVKEWIIAIRLERQYTKNEILAMYCNVYDFGNYSVGVSSAAQTYFSKEPKDLTTDESAMLVGMFKNSGLYNPIRNPEGVKNRRNVVLGQMVKAKMISEAEKERLQALPIALKFKLESHREGTATYFREYLRDYLKKWVTENKKPDGSDYDIYKDGLRIYTTIDSRMQSYAEEAVSAHMQNLQQQFFIEQKNNKNAPFVNITQAETERIMMQAMKNSVRWAQMKDADKSEDDIIASFKIKTRMRVFTWKGERDTVMTPMDSIRYYKHFLQSGLMAMEPQTGNIKAWVGGINYKYFQYDHVGQGARQVGSTFKPFVYATAIEELNMSPCDSILDGPFMIHKGRHHVTEDWEPRNSDYKYRGMVTLKQALAASINTVSAKLIDRTSPEAVVELTKKLGVKTEIPVQPSIALGAVDITVEDMVAAYSTFANQGVYVKPQFLSRIENKSGEVIYEPIPESHDVLNKDIAFAVIKLLQGVTESGSGVRLRTQGGGSGDNRWTGYPYMFKNPIAGKTGTTQNQSDGWFMGMVPNLVTGVWVGCEDRSARFKSLTYGQGATAALPVWGYFMKKCYEDKNLQVSKGEFERPANLSIKVDCYQRPAIVKDTTQTEQNTDEFEL
ncbi:penicillin-binding protein 1A [Flavobacterium johnsoniae]|jgi:penicillin-binding protein 1A|uniref:Penicillin-binding protein 1A n=2 Tax=Flavobacterium johnsoniae TaxID=986 RepID=Q8KRN9_FLAJO|nr:transglycosylase domain-containing protein [Flavobacterium johnsoniae]AAM92020.1 penicillin-binding protein 1A [Flavobacterium johnsoniae]ABQ03923.1 Candidate bifunctional family GT51 beta-glycosyltransferase/PBP transpeptidase (candidate murein polymerase); Glycosyltransferase family 51 [Flavobacterium johnsoniae UW101]OXE96207.1 penicillin-binding protein [Flavobacterium johnsoniae UW101]WQG79210.1 transglycosylase domain-containing protein [Flavobacterium johnsoniae UW101]SHH23728.1 peni